MLKKKKITSIYNLIDDYDEMQYKLQRDERQSTKNSIFSLGLSSIIMVFICWIFNKLSIIMVFICWIFNKLSIKIEISNIVFLILFLIILIAIVINVLTYNYFSIRGMNEMLKEITEKYNLKQEKTSINQVLNNLGSQNFKINKKFKCLDYNTVNSIFYFKTSLVYEKIDDKNLEILHKELEEIRKEERKKKTTSLVSFLKNNGVLVIVSLLFAAIINNYYSSLFNNFIELKKNSGYISNMHEIFWQHILFILLILCFLIVMYFFISLSVPDSKKIEMDKLKVINEALYHLKEELEVNRKMVKISKIKIFKNFLEKERPLNKGILTKLENNLKTNFIYNSNAIEGNTLTLKETDIILQYGVTVKGKSLKEHEEVKGQEYAINFLKEIIKRNETLSLRLIREFHSLVLNDDIENRGKFKQSNNEIPGAGFETTPYYLVEEKLTELIKKYNGNKVDNLVTKVSHFHADFEKIHPFIDGNGRTGRLLLNLELMKNGYPITVIQNEEREEYYTALETAQAKADYRLLTDFIEKSIENIFWIYYKYFDKNTKIKFEEYLENKGINPQEIYQKRFENYPETERDFPRDWDK